MHDRDKDMGMDGDDREEKKFGGRRKSRPPVDLELDYKRPETLRPFLTQEGKIVPSRVSRLNAAQQRKVTMEIKRARHLALLPFAGKHITQEPGSRFGGYRDRERSEYRSGDREPREVTAPRPNAAPQE